MRRVLLVALAWLVLPPAAAADGEPCGFEHTRVDVVRELHVYAEMERRECPEGRSLMIAATDGTGRTSLEWYDDERGLGAEVHRPPYFVSWTDTERGCVMVVYVFSIGEVPIDCVAGSPPPPPYLP